MVVQRQRGIAVRFRSQIQSLFSIITFSTGLTTTPNAASTESVSEASSLHDQATSSNSMTTDSQSSIKRALEDARRDSAKYSQATLAACGQQSVEVALGAGKGVGRIVGAGLKSPMDFTLSIARGFHNAPKLYGDDTVRQADKITDFQSGLKAAGKVIASVANLRTTANRSTGVWLRPI